MLLGAPVRGCGHIADEAGKDWQPADGIGVTQVATSTSAESLSDLVATRSSRRSRHLCVVMLLFLALGIGAVLTYKLLADSAGSKSTSSTAPGLRKTLEAVNTFQTTTTDPADAVVNGDSKELLDEQNVQNLPNLTATSKTTTQEFREEVIVKEPRYVTATTTAQANQEDQEPVATTAEVPQMHTLQTSEQPWHGATNSSTSSASVTTPDDVQVLSTEQPGIDATSSSTSSAPVTTPDGVQIHPTEQPQMNATSSSTSSAPVTTSDGVHMHSTEQPWIDATSPSTSSAPMTTTDGAQMNSTEESRNDATSSSAPSSPVTTSDVEQINETEQLQNDATSSSTSSAPVTIPDGAQANSTEQLRNDAISSTTSPTPVSTSDIQQLNSTEQPWNDAVSGTSSTSTTSPTDGTRTTSTEQPGNYEAPLTTSSQPSTTTHGTSMASSGQPWDDNASQATSSAGALPPSPPLPAVRRCYLAALRQGEGCTRLSALEGAEFDLNELGQDGSGKRSCLEQLRRAGGNTFAFALGHCELSASTWSGCYRKGFCCSLASNVPGHPSFSRTPLTIL
eukprot:TRINITY_DN8790_c0_g1_i4.p1 TRINITY_DN8790_c0_g1~~TRINITY_DN8790_c0_g1_i4.p1  ORF type:complete len:564 (+),score=88.10 TRINITY_DN8790_c0_g1_i4:34-1725(+)